LRIADQERLKALLQQQGHVIWRLMACSPMWDTRVHRTRA
jgi:hypothetical protein